METSPTIHVTPPTNHAEYNESFQDPRSSQSGSIQHVGPSIGHFSPFTSRITLVEDRPVSDAIAPGIYENAESSNRSELSKSVDDRKPNFSLLIRSIINSIFGKCLPIHDDKPESMKDSPYIKEIYVHSKVRNNLGQPISHCARCIFDTGNYQGNIVSKDFLLGTLGYLVSDIRKLSPEEKQGGTAITGDPVVPIGVVRLTWWHETSSLFRDMRFLVCPQEHFDLIIGAESIEKYHLVGEINFSACRIGGRKVDRDTQAERIRKNKEVVARESKLREADIARRGGPTGLPELNPAPQQLPPYVADPNDLTVGYTLQAAPSPDDDPAHLPIQQDGAPIFGLRKLRINTWTSGTTRRTILS